MTHQGSAVVHQCPPAVECLCTRRSVSAATDAIGAYRFIDGRYESEVPPRDCHVGRWPPRNDKSEAGFILTKACTGRRRCAGRGMPLPYNARLETSCNFTLTAFHFPLAPCRTDNDRPHPDRRGRSFSVYLPYRRSYIVFMRRRRWASSAVSRPGCSRQLQLRSLSVPGVFMRASAPRPR